MKRPPLWRPPPTREYKARDPRVTSVMMAAVRHKDSRAELALRQALFGRGLRYRLHSRSLVGKPDIVFPSARVVVFVDSDYWHGRALIENGERAFRQTMRTARVDWWVAKFNRTIARDLEVSVQLKREGWRVMRFWESDVLRSPDRVAGQIERITRYRLARR